MNSVDQLLDKDAWLSLWVSKSGNIHAAGLEETCFQSSWWEMRNPGFPSWLSERESFESTLDSKMMQTCMCALPV
jgi:hypothetical protein